MGYNTTVVVLNDALSAIRDDPDFGRKLYEAICMTGHPNGARHWVSAGNHCTAAFVVETHHADHHVYVRVGGNNGRVVDPDEIGDRDGSR